MVRSLSFTTIIYSAFNYFCFLFSFFLLHYNQATRWCLWSSFGTGKCGRWPTFSWRIWPPPTWWWRSSAPASMCWWCWCTRTGFSGQTCWARCSVSSTASCAASRIVLPRAFYWYVAQNNATNKYWFRHFQLHPPFVWCFSLLSCITLFYSYREWSHKIKQPHTLTKLCLLIVYADLQ